MGRNRTPTEILDAKGAFIANPQRKRPGEPKAADGIGPAPRRLTDAEKAIWKELAEDSAPGVLKRSDRNMFELLVVLTARFRDRLDAAIVMTAADRSLMLSLASRFAMTPADRSKVIVEGQVKSRLEEFLARRRTPAEEAVQ
jgi:hypothetical protein